MICDMMKTEWFHWRAISGSSVLLSQYTWMYVILYGDGIKHHFYRSIVLFTKIGKNKLTTE